MANFRRINTHAILSFSFVMLLVICCPASFAQQSQELHPKYSMQFFELRVENQDLRMAYRDVMPTGTSNGKVVLLLEPFRSAVLAFLATQGSSR